MLLWLEEMGAERLARVCESDSIVCCREAIVAACLASASPFSPRCLVRVSRSSLSLSGAAAFDPMYCMM